MLYNLDVNKEKNKSHKGGQLSVGFTLQNSDGKAKNLPGSRAAAASPPELNLK